VTGVVGDEKSVDALRRMHSLKAMLEALVGIDHAFLEQHRRRTGEPYAPVLQAARAIVVLHEDVWRDIPSIVLRGETSLSNIACWRIAELRAAGKDASPWIVGGPGSAISIKIRIDDEDGSVRIEDPADLLERAG